MFKINNIMNWDLFLRLTFLLIMVVYLTQLPLDKLRAFGNFIKKILGVLPITKIAEAYIMYRNHKKDSK